MVRLPLGGGLRGDSHEPRNECGATKKKAKRPNSAPMREAGNDENAHPASAASRAFAKSRSALVLTFALPVKLN
jgi:hypothetical protein